MHVLLIKCHARTWMTRLKPIVTEPLELEMLAGVLNGFKNEGVTYRLFDPMLEGGKTEKLLKREKPDLVLLSGYITAVSEILRIAGCVKMRYPESLVWVGGVHAEGSPQDFYSQNVDAVFFSDALEALRSLFEQKFQNGHQFSDGYPITRGIAWKQGGTWIQNARTAASAAALPIPDRRYFEAHVLKTRYITEKPVALVKTALSCPHPCDFCYCRGLNEGVYEERPLEKVVEELREINADTIWIVDDCFLTTRARAEAWILALEQLALQGIRKRLIAYARADALVKFADLVPRLKDVGFKEWIVGMEAVEDMQLLRMGKALQEEDNAQAAAVLKEAGVTLTALFLVTPDDSAEDFKRLRRWIQGHNIRRYTVSILTPLKGTSLYELYQPRLTELRFLKYDFLHLVMKPTKMSTLGFYIRFWNVSLKARLR